MRACAGDRAWRRSECPHSLLLSREALCMTHMAHRSRYDTSSHSVMDTAHRSSRIPGGHACRSVLRYDQHASATVPGVRDARSAGCQPVCSHPRHCRQVIAVAAGAPAGSWHAVPRCTAHPADRRSLAGSRGLNPCLTACKPRWGYPAARPAPLPAVRPAPQGLSRRETGFEPAASPALTPSLSPASRERGVQNRVLRRPDASEVVSGQVFRPPLNARGRGATRAAC